MRSLGRPVSKDVGHAAPERLPRGRRVRAFPVLLVAMGLLLYAYRLGQVHFWSAAEGQSAMAARHMLSEGDWLLPEPPRNLLAQAPPLHAWLVACCFWISGLHSEATARFPSALAAVATLILIYRHGCFIGSHRLGRTAALATGLSVLFVWQARLAEADALFCLFVALAFTAATRAIAGRAGYFAVLHGALGLAIMTKGFVALLFVAAPLAVYLTWQRQWRCVLGRRAFWGTLPVLVTVGGAWYAYVLLLVPNALPQSSWLEVVRNTGHRESIHYYLTRLPLAWLPLTFILPWALALPWKPNLATDEPLHARAAARLALCWFAVPLIFLFLWPRKQTDYVLPLVPALGVLAALVLEGRAPSSGFWALPSRAHGAKLAAWLIPTICAVAAPVLAVQGHAGGAWLLFAAAALLTLVSLAARLSLDWSRRFGLEAVLVELWIVLLVVCGHLVPQFNLEMSHKPFLRLVRRLVPPHEPLAGVQLHANDLYYLDRPVTLLPADRASSSAADYVLVSRRWLDSQPPDRFVSILKADVVGRNRDLELVRVGTIAMSTDQRGPKR